MALLTPPGQVPDEPAHMTRAEGLQRGEILGHRQVVVDGATGKPIVTSGVDVNSSLLRASFGQLTVLGSHLMVTPANAAAEMNIARDSAVTFSMAPNTVRSFPAFYLPAALGLEVGWLAGFSPYHSFLLGRFGMLASFLAMGAAAIWAAAFGESLIVAVLLLPMSIFLGSSLNVDGQLIGAACLAGALLTRKPHRRWQLAAAVLLVLIAGTKPPYIALLGGVLLPLVWPDIKRRAAWLALGAAAVLAWSAVIARTVLVPFRLGAYHPGPLWRGDHTVTLYAANTAGNLHILLAQPLRLITLPLHSLWVLGHQNIVEAIGVLGALSIILPHRLYDAWGIAMILAGVGAVVVVRPDAACWRWRDAVWVSLLIVATVYGIELSTYLSWTNLGDTVINGVTGRYFLPLLPFLPLILPRLRDTAGRGTLLLRVGSVIPVFALAIFDSFYLPMTLIGYYYP